MKRKVIWSGTVYAVFQTGYAIAFNDDGEARSFNAESLPDNKRLLLRPDVIVTLGYDDVDGIYSVDIPVLTQDDLDRANATAKEPVKKLKPSPRAA